MTPIAQFLQTERWAEFQEALGHKVFFVCGDGKRWQALLVRHDLPSGLNYLYCPRGPIIEHDPEVLISEFLKEAAEIAKREKSIFMRWDPPFNADPKNLSPKTYHLKPCRSVQPRHTAVIELAKTEEELLAAMHEKTRYNIRLAERKGVRVREVPGSAGIDVFWELMKVTTERDVFAAHSREHYAKLLDMFSEHGAAGQFARLYVAELGNEPLAAAIVMFHGGTATYLHGASSNRNRNAMAPYLLHWRIMQDAKVMGLAAYDLWGIDDQNPRWAGITRFKRGFGGSEESFAPSCDIVFRPVFYGIYKLARSLITAPRIVRI